MTAAKALPETLDLDLDGLCNTAAPFMARLPVADQRIQSAPDSRTLRFYQSTGLLDRPLRYDGRVARYGRRHLLQVLAVRVLQSKGLSLAQVQAQLAGATDTELERQVSETLGLTAPAPGHFDYPLPLFRPRAPTPAKLAESAQPSASLRSPSPDSATMRAVAPLSAAELAPGLVLTIDSRKHPNPARIIELLRRALQGEET